MSNAPSNARSIASRYARTERTYGLTNVSKTTDEFFQLRNAHEKPTKIDAPTQSDTRQARTLDGYHLTQSRVSRPSVARECTHRRSSALSERVGTAHRFTAGMTRQRGYLLDPEHGVFKAVVGSQVTRVQETYPYPGLELITPAGDRRKPSPPLSSTIFMHQSLTGGFLAPRQQADRGIDGWKIKRRTPKNGLAALEVVAGWVETESTFSGGRCSRAVRLRTKATGLSTPLPTHPLVHASNALLGCGVILVALPTKETP